MKGILIMVCFNILRHITQSIVHHNHICYSSSFDHGSPQPLAAQGAGHRASLLLQWGLSLDFNWKPSTTPITFQSNPRVQFVHHVFSPNSSPLWDKSNGWLQATHPKKKAWDRGIISHVSTWKISERNHQLGTNMSHLGKLEKSSTQKCLFKRGYVGSQDSTLKTPHLSTTMQWRWHHYSLDASAVKNESFVGHDPLWFSKCQQIIKAFPVPTISMIQQYHFIAMGNSSN